MYKKQFIVIGLGRFGMALTRTLSEHQHEVLAIDKDMHLVEEAAQIATQAIQADCTDEEALAEIGVQNFQHAIVAIGEDLQASSLVTLLLKEMGVPKVTAKANNEIHGKMLDKVGADQIIYPERDMAIRLGNRLSSETLIDYIEFSPDYNLVEFRVPETMHNQTLQDLKLRAKYGCNVITIKHGDKINMSPKADDILYTGDIILILGSKEDIERLEAEYE